MIRVLADSNEEVHVPLEHNLPTDSFSKTTSTSSSSTMDAITRAITDFPNKRQKTMMMKKKTSLQK